MFLYNNYNKTNPDDKKVEKEKDSIKSDDESSLSEPQNIEDVSNNDSDYDENTESSSDKEEVCKPPTPYPKQPKNSPVKENLSEKEKNRNLESILSPRCKNYKSLAGFFDTDSEIDSDIGSEESEIDSEDDDNSYDIKNAYTDEQPEYVICIDGIPYGSADNEKDAEYYTW